MTHEDHTARKIVGILQQGTSVLDAATAGKLASARSRAVNLAHEVQAAQAAPAHAVTGHFILARISGNRARLAAGAALLLALLAWLAAQQDFSTSKVETDTLLLASELPPEAYADQGFHTWLKNASQL